MTWSGLQVKSGTAVTAAATVGGQMSSGYFERARTRLPRQGDRAPWRLSRHYAKDRPLFRRKLDDGALRFDPLGTGGGAPGPGAAGVAWGA
jgi:hypothetical protein